MLPIDLSGKLVLVAGVADDQGFGWAIAKALKKAGAKIIIAAWPPTMNILLKSLERGKFNTDLGEGEKLTFEKIYPLDAIYDEMSQVPEEVRTNRRYADTGDFTMQGLRDNIVKDFGENTLFACVHSLANGPEVQNSLLETSRAGYLAANSASAYSFVSMIQKMAPIMQKNGSFLALSYLASEQIVPGYGGGMSSAKAALESDTRTLAYEVGRKYHQRVNVISAGALASRAAKAIGFIEKLVKYSEKNAPIPASLKGHEVGNVAAFLCSPLAEAMTGGTFYVDYGLNAMGAVPDEWTQQ